MSAQRPIKICCIQNAAEARLALRHGAAALGFVSAMPSGFGPIPEPAIAEIMATVPPEISTFLLTSKTEAADIVAQQRRTGANTLQLCAPLAADVRAALRHALPGVRLVQVVHVTGREAIGRANDAMRDADALLLDTGVLAGPVRQLGGTGRTHDWTVSREIVAAAGTPVWLAGGLNADNVASAVQTVRPYGIDVCSGVRTNQVLDEAKLAAFAAAVRASG